MSNSKQPQPLPKCIMCNGKQLLSYEGQTYKTICPHCGGTGIEPVTSLPPVPPTKKQYCPLCHRII